MRADEGAMLDYADTDHKIFNELKAADGRGNQDLLQGEQPLLAVD
jgi:hypothetical protein